jgi:hypothetical protein
VLFIGIVGYAKLSINKQHSGVDELTRVVRDEIAISKMPDPSGSFDQGATRRARFTVRTLVQKIRQNRKTSNVFAELK